MHCSKSFNLDSNGHVDTGCRTFEISGFEPGTNFFTNFPNKGCHIFLMPLVDESPRRYLGFSSSSNIDGVIKRNVCPKKFLSCLFR